jgi:diguanylate cyclase (GGDEF)-like protein
MMDLDAQRSASDGRVQKHGALCIAEVGRIIREQIGSAGCACRFAGEDFLALLHPLDAARGLELAERIRARVADGSGARGDGQTSPTISIGLAELHPGLPTLDHLLQAADEALFRAKAAGRNQVSR